MPQNLSEFEQKVSLLLEANTTPQDISNILNRPIKSIYNSISRVKRKKSYKGEEIKKKRGRVSKASPREKRVINRDYTNSPKKVIKRILLENNLTIRKRSL